MKLHTILTLLGTAIALAALGIYFSPMLNLPLFDDGDGPKIILAGLGGGWALVGTVQGFRLGRSALTKVFLALLLLVAVAAAAIIPFHAFVVARALPEPSKLAGGEAAPNFALTDQNGKSITLSSFKGKRLVLGFHIGHFCPWCAKQIKIAQGKLADIRAAGGDVAFVSADDAEQTREFAARLGVEFSLLADPQYEAIKAYGLANPVSLINTTLARPAVFFINADGTMVSSWQPDDLRKMLNADDMMALFNKTR